MEVNDELAVLRRAIPAAIDAIAVGGRVVVESYHSLEDRLVKQAFTAATTSTVPEDLPVRARGPGAGAAPGHPGCREGGPGRDRRQPARRLGAAARHRTCQHQQGSLRMSSPAVQLRSRMPRIAWAAVERARLTVVPRRRTKAARMPFVLLVSLVLLGGVVGLLLFNTSMQQASFAATSLERAGRHPDRPAADPGDGARRPAQPPARRRAGPGHGHGVPPAPLFLRPRRPARCSASPAPATAVDRSAAAAEAARRSRAILNPPPSVRRRGGRDAESLGDTTGGSGVTDGAGGSNGTDGNRTTDRNQR